jgi:tetratricopeptide (TPR) repeat protein
LNEVMAMTHKLLIIVVLGLAAPAQAQEGAIAERKAAAAAQPKEASAQTALGRALWRAGHWAEAEQRLKLAARLAGNSLESLYELAQVQFARGDHQAALRACQALVKADKEAVLSQVCMARAFLVWKRSSLAFEYLDKAGEDKTGHIERELALADAYRIKGDVAKSLAEYERVIVKAPRDARPYFGLGLLYNVFGPPQKAAEALREALDRDPESPEIQLELGKLLPGEQGRQLLQKAVEGRPNWDEATVALGNAWLSEGDAKSASDYAQKALKLSPSSADAHLLLGRAWLKQGRYQPAEKELRRALALIPNHYLATVTLAELLAKTNRPEEAFESYRVAAGLLNKDATPLLEAARLALALDRKTLAAGFLDLALERSPNSAPILALYGEVLATRGDKVNARHYYERALKASGEIDRTRIQKLLSELK